jgi:peptidyl serine alpha-galactosyltransferase
MPRLISQGHRQLKNPRSGSTKEKGAVVSATQCVLLIVTLAGFFLFWNAFHLASRVSLHEPLPREQLLERQEQPAQQVEGRIRFATSVPRGPNVEYHIIFSTGCSPKQNFQAYIFFFHAMKSQQPGKVTRIAACKEEQEAKALTAHHKQFIEPMSPNFLLHITPDYSEIKGGEAFHYFNKPFSCHHWMEHALGYNPKHKQVGDNPHDNVIVILCDPDQIIMRPFTNNQLHNTSEIWIKRTTHPIIGYVDHGKPMGQMYGFYDQWATKTNITRYVPKEELPSFVQTMSEAEKRENYAVGPPYLASAFDFYTIVTRWKDFVPLVHDDYPHLLAEMFAYCLAAAHSRLPHQMAKGFMVSDAGSLSAEGWDLMNGKSVRDMCTPGAIPKDHLPHILHYCQRYALGKWVIGKHRIPLDFLSCEAPLLAEPPVDVGEKFNFMIEPDKKKEEKHKLPAHVIKNHAFMLCHLIPYLNEVAIYWKGNHCNGKTPNKQKSLTFFDNMEVAPHFFTD